MLGWMIGISATIVSMFMSVYMATSGHPHWGMLWLGLMIVSFVAAWVSFIVEARK